MAAGARTFEDRDDGHAAAHILQPLEDKPPVGASCCHAPGLMHALVEERPRNLRRLTAHVTLVLERPRGGRRARELVDKLAHLCKGAHHERAHVTIVRELDLSRTRGGARGGPSAQLVERARLPHVLAVHTLGTPRHRTARGWVPQGRVRVLRGGEVDELQLRETVDLRDSTTTARSGERDAHVRHHAPPVTREDTVKAPRRRIRHGRPKEARHLKAEINTHLEAVCSDVA